MIVLGNKRLCSGCFSPIKKEPCKKCGFSEESYVPDKLALPCGTALMGKFLVGRVLGKGGFGITYLAYDVTYDKIIAVKEYFPVEYALRASDGIGVVARDRRSAELFKHGETKFYSEASIVAGFSSCPNIVKVYQFFYENNTAYFTMEYLSGMTLKDYVYGCGTLTEGQAVTVADKAAKALHVVHSGGILHRDVCPDNIMLCGDGSVKLLDFGAARQVFHGGSQLMSVIIKPGFAPLEQYSKSGAQDAWTDIYALGGSLYFALTKHIPENPQDRLMDDSELQNALCGIRPELQEVLLKALQLRYADRYRSAEEFRTALAYVPIKQQEIRLPRVKAAAAEKSVYGEEDSPLKKLLAKLFGG